MYNHETVAEAEARELQHESLMVDVAQLAFDKRARKAKDRGQETTLNSTQSHFLRSIDIVGKQIEHEIQMAVGPAPGVKKLHWLALKDDNPMELAAIVCYEVMNVGTYGAKAMEVESKVVKRIQELRAWKEFRNKNKEHFKKLRTYLNETTGGSYKRQKMTQTAVQSGVDYKGHRIEVAIGAALLKCFILATGLAHIVNIRKPGNTKHTISMIEFVPEVKADLAKRHGEFGHNFPDKMPMLCKPDPWTSLSNGGFICNALSGSLIRHATDEYKREVNVSDLQPMLDGVNRIQETGFRVNQRVHALADYLFYHKERGNIQTRSLPEPASRHGQPELPDYPFELPGMTVPERKDAYAKMMDEDKDGLKRINSKRRALKDTYNKEVSKWEASKNTLKVARILNNMKGLKYRLDKNFLKRTQGMYQQPEDSFYYSISTDFRGRNYALSKHLNLQGGSLQKGLLEFAVPEKVGTKGAYWLKVSLANSLGTAPDGTKVDKMTFDDRAKWVDDNYQLIIDTAKSYEFELTEGGKLKEPSFEYTVLFEAADSPWEFIAAAMELADYWNNPSPDFESHAIVLLDAAQSGIQHLTGMMKDEVSARFVNILPNEQPYDMYKKVADTVEKRIADKLTKDIPFKLDYNYNANNSFWEVYATIDLFKEEPKPFRCTIYKAKSEADAKNYKETTSFTPADILKRWQGNIDRKLCKKSVMTKVYNSKMYRQNEFIEEFLDKQIASGDFKDEHGHNTDCLLYEIKPDEQNPMRWSCIRYFVTELWHTIDSVVEGPAQLMAWFNEVAAIVAKNQQFIWWTSPIGLLVSQSTAKYRKTKSFTVDLILQQLKGTPKKANKPRVSRKGAHATDEVRVDDATRAFSPNFVHSFDAALLLDSANKAYEKGVRNFAFVHDAYGTSPASVDKLIQSAKESYISIYSVDVLDNLYRELVEQTGLEIPRPPELGNLDVTEVLKSDYFLA